MAFLPLSQLSYGTVLTCLEDNLLLKETDSTNLGSRFDYVS